MTRLLIGSAVGVAIGLVIGAAFGLHAEGTIPDPETISLATKAGLDPVDLLGAANTVGVSPATYLATTCDAADGLLCPAPPVAPVRVSSSPGWPIGGARARVRLTHYVESGVTYGGGHPYPGSTACSWNFALGTRFVLPDGEVFTCNDRGLLGSTGWLDLWRRPDLVGRYGPFTTVTVLP